MRVEFMGLKEAEKIKPDNTLALISISNEMSIKNLSPDWDNILELEFDDVDQDVFTYTTFNSQMAKQVITFIQTLPETVECVVVHCWAGVSRSAAIAKFLALYYDSYFPKDYGLYNKLVYSTLLKTYNQLQEKGEINIDKN